MASGRQYLPSTASSEVFSVIFCILLEGRFFVSLACNMTIDLQPLCLAHMVFPRECEKKDASSNYSRSSGVNGASGGFKDRLCILLVILSFRFSKPNPNYQ